jgi:hypothetical protein
MRWTPWILAAAIVAGCVGRAAGGQPVCIGCGGMAVGLRSQWSLGCDPCCAPPGYCLAPGCCEFQRRCCDNAWAGYCQHRARVEAFWAGAGVPKPRCRPAGYWGAPTAACPEGPPAGVPPMPAVGPASRLEPRPAVAPLPPLPPSPATPVASPPAPDNVTTRAYHPWLR